MIVLSSKDRVLLSGSPKILAESIKVINVGLVTESAGGNTCALAWNEAWKVSLKELILPCSRSDRLLASTVLIIISVSLVLSIARVTLNELLML